MFHLNTVRIRARKSPMRNKCKEKSLTINISKCSLTFTSEKLLQDPRKSEMIRDGGEGEAG